MIIIYELLMKKFMFFNVENNYIYFMIARNYKTTIGVICKQIILYLDLFAYFLNT